jgi:outer membrane protein assembly factor BamB
VSRVRVTIAARAAATGLMVLLVSACSFSPNKPEPTPLSPVAALLGTERAWTAQVGPGPAHAAPHAVGSRVYLAGAGGTVVAIDAETGRDLWRASLGTPLATGVGADGETAAVVTQDNALIALSNGQQRWRVQLPAKVFTTPLVAGGRVFVVTAGRTVLAFDGSNGARLWSQQRSGEPLVLSQAGALLAVGDTLVAGLSGRLTGLNPQNGSIRWEAPIATPRGTNEVERLVDLVGPVSRLGDSVCARAYSAAVGCVDASRGSVAWTQPAQGSAGLAGGDRLVFGTESDGRVRAWQRASGEAAWTVDRLKYRNLSAPLAVGRVVAVGDATGTVHLLSREDGSELTRLTTDGSAIVGGPVLAGQVLLVQTRNGGVFAWRPQ